MNDVFITLLLGMAVACQFTNMCCSSLYVAFIGTVVDFAGLGYLNDVAIAYTIATHETSI